MIIKNINKPNIDAPWKNVADKNPIIDKTIDLISLNFTQFTIP